MTSEFTYLSLLVHEGHHSLENLLHFFGCDFFLASK